MASTTALFTALSGLTANSRNLEVIGNNIANVNTTAFKSNRMLFAPTFNRSFSLGTAPSSSSGGTNPGQVGLGVTIAGTQRNFNNGAINVTGISTDLAIEGDGFFIVEQNGEQFFTRAGAFQTNSQNELITLSGARVQGFGIDEDFNVVSGRLESISVPLGTLTLAEATENVTFSGNLNADSDVAVNGSIFTFAALTAGGAPITTATLLTALDPAGTFAVDDVITISGASRGGKNVPDASFTVGAASTVQDFLEFLQEALGVVPDGGFTAGDPTGAPEPGSFSVDAAGVITFVGNFGELNDLDLDVSDFSVVDSAGASKANPFVPTKTQAADGESVRTTFTVYDSLGTALNIDLTMVLAFKDDNGTYWRSFLHSSDDSDLALHLETGDRTGTYSDAVPLLQFDNFGSLVSSPTVSVEVDRDNSGALSPLSVTLTFDSDSDAVTALSDTGGSSAIAAVFQDGSPIGILSSFSVGNDGIITGGFTNGLTRTIGQIALATFTNPAGLVDAGNNLFRIGPNSGTALVTSPLEFGTGRVVGGALELSNVDLSQEFINMILTTTGYSASARVITTTNELIQQLLLLGR